MKTIEDLPDTFWLDLGALGEAEMSFKESYWERLKTTVVYDGYTDYGVRILIVKSSSVPAHNLVSNAIVFSWNILEELGLIGEEKSNDV